MEVDPSVSIYLDSDSFTLLFEVRGPFNLELVFRSIVTGREHHQQNEIWDFRECSINDLNIQEVQGIVGRSANYPRIEGLAAYIVKNDAQHARVRQYLTVDESGRSGAQKAKIFRIEDEAFDWIGISTTDFDPVQVITPQPQ